MSYSKKYKERTIEYRISGHTLKETHEVFKIERSTIQKWERQYKETGNLEKKEVHRSYRKIDPEKLKVYMAEHPDSYQSEMAEAFDCIESGIRYALWRYKITRKKTIRYQEQDLQKVATYLGLVLKIKNDQNGEMSRYEITEEQQKKIKGYFPERRSKRGRPGKAIKKC